SRRARSANAACARLTTATQRPSEDRHARTAAVRGGYIGHATTQLGRDEVSHMAAKDRIGKVGEAARAAQRSRYVQRLLEDEDLRGNLITAYGAARSAYGRMANGKP